MESCKPALPGTRATVECELWMSLLWTEQQLCKDMELENLLGVWAEFIPGWRRAWVGGGE